MYEFSLASMIWGFVIMVIGAGIVYFYRQLSHFFGGGPGMYQRYKLYGLIAVIFGVLLLFNIPQFLLTSLLSLFFKS